MQGELVKPGHPIAASTVWQILHDAGIAPAPCRTGPTWKQFLTAHSRGILAAGFVHVDTVLLRRIYALIVIEHGTRRVHLAGLTANPDGAWATQAARNFLMDLGQRTGSAKFLIRDRAGQFTGAFGAVFQAEGARILASPPQAPRANAICERIIGTLRRELPGRLLIASEHHLGRVLTEYLRHCNTARPHRALGQLAPRVHQASPPTRTLVSSTSHPGSPPSPAARATTCPLASENLLNRRVLPTGRQPTGPPQPRISKLDGRDHFCQHSIRPRAARRLQDSRAAAVHPSPPAPAPADLHRQPAQLRIQQIGVLA